MSRWGRAVPPLALILIVIAVAAPIYKWVDASGHVHYSDQPPPSQSAGEPVELLPPPSGDEVRSARERLDDLLSKNQAASDKRAADEQRKQREQELAEAQRADRLRRCTLAQQNLQILEIRRPVFQLDAKGERQFLSDAERSAELERVRSEIAEYCQ